jgi:DNA-binding HxlR family transcriptional regulator
LEADGIVVRKDMSDLVLHIEYELDESTREGVYALLDHLAKWADFILANREMTKNSYRNTRPASGKAASSTPQRDSGKGAGGGT